MEPHPTRLREEARRLRGVAGLSFREIANALPISQSTARRWTLDIALSPGQLARIESLWAASAARGNESIAVRYRERRQIWQLEGRRRAREGDVLHQAGCLLYWAEGSKSRNTVCLANSDMHLVRLFCRFLSECFGIRPDQLHFRLHVYTGNGLTIREIEDRWLTVLGLPRACLGKHSINTRPAPTSGAKKNKLPFGVGNLQVRRSTSLIQHIYGAIQEYGGFDEPRWLDLPR